VFVPTRESFVTDILFPVKDMWTTIRLAMKVTLLPTKAATKDIVSLEIFGSIQHKTLSGGGGEPSTTLRSSFQSLYSRLLEFNFDITQKRGYFEEGHRRQYSAYKFVRYN